MPQSDAHRKVGIFSRSLRHAPLTLTTLAALVPRELGSDLRIIDEGVVLSTTFLANLGYNVYSRLMPDYMPMPCEVDPWDEACDQRLASKATS